MSDELLSAHMVQHLLLIVVAAPLLVLGSPALVIGQAMSPAWRRRAHRSGRAKPLRAVVRFVTHPLTTWLMATVVLWVWHVPSLYQAALEHQTVHVLEHAAFLGTAMLFWWTALQPTGPRRLPRGAQSGRHHLRERACPRPAFSGRDRPNEPKYGSMRLGRSIGWLISLYPYDRATQRCPIGDCRAPNRGARLSGIERIGARIHGRRVE